MRLAALAVLVAGCSLRPDPMFDCRWARVRDWQENTHAHLTGSPARSNWTANFCGVSVDEAEAATPVTVRKKASR